MNHFFHLLAQYGAGPDGNPNSGLFGFDWNEVIAAVSAVLISVGGGWWAYRSTKSTSEDQARAIFTTNLLQDYDKLRDQFLKLQSEMLQIHNEVYQLKNKLEFYEENTLAADARELLSKVMSSSDRMMWVHSVASNQWYLNDSYCEFFNIRRSSFWTPINILARYPKEYTLKYIENDLQTIESNISLQFEETANKDIMNPKCIEKVRLIVKKTPFEVRSNKYIIGEVIEVLGEKIDG